VGSGRNSRRRTLDQPPPSPSSEKKTELARRAQAVGAIHLNHQGELTRHARQSVLARMQDVRESVQR
jgi:hypothetical protein